MTHGDAFRDPPRHARGGTEEPARWNELCLPQRAWRSWPSTVALASDTTAVTCRACLEILASREQQALR
jgi:hypothetical protein